MVSKIHINLIQPIIFMKNTNRFSDFLLELISFTVGPACVFIRVFVSVGYQSLNVNREYVNQPLTKNWRPLNSFEHRQRHIHHFCVCLLARLFVCLCVCLFVCLLSGEILLSDDVKC